MALAADGDLFSDDLRLLIKDFNKRAALSDGSDVITYAIDTKTANAICYIRKGLFEETGAIGNGQTLSAGTTFIGSYSSVTVMSFGMYLEMDRRFFSDRLGKNDGAPWYDKQKLFFHEVGHGMGFLHNDTDKRDVMYRTTDGDKDFDPFFDRVRAVVNSYK